MNPLRITAVVPLFCHPDWRAGGVARTATDLLFALAGRGHSVTVLSPTRDGDQSFPLPPQTTFCDGRLTLLYDNASRPTRRGISARGLRPLLAPLLPRTDVVHIHSFLSPFTDAAASIARRAGVPYVIQDHGKLTPTILAHRAILKRAYLSIRGRRLLRAAARVVPSADVIAQAIRLWDPSIRCETCTNGLPPEGFDGPPPPPPVDHPYVLFLGWLDPRKNPDLLLRAFARIARDPKTAHWKLALVGPDPYRQAVRLRTLASTLAVADRVIFRGMVQGQTKQAWLRNAGLFVLPSSGEGLSLAMLEALASGVPCLLSPGCNYPEIEPAHAGLTLPLHEQLWADAMLSMITDARARRAAGAAARELFLRQHTIDAVAAHLEGILSVAASQGSKARVA